MATDYAELYGLPEDPDMVLKCFFPFVMNCGLQINIDVHHSLLFTLVWINWRSSEECSGWVT